MITSNNSTGTRGAAGASFKATGAEKDAADWAKLMDDWLGPDNDVYARLRQRPEAQTGKARASA